MRNNVCIQGWYFGLTFYRPNFHPIVEVSINRTYFHLQPNPTQGSARDLLLLWPLLQQKCHKALHCQRAMRSTSGKPVPTGAGPPCWQDTEGELTVASVLAGQQGGSLGWEGGRKAGRGETGWGRADWRMVQVHKGAGTVAEAVVPRIKPKV